MTASLQDTYAPRSTCFGCGPRNSDGLRLKSFVDGETLIARWSPQPQFEAFADTLNGGIIGVLLDCHCNWTASYHLMQAMGSDHPPCTVTAEYKVSFVAPTDATEEVTLEARLAELGTRSAKIRGELRSRGVLTASCDAVFVKVKPGIPPTIAGEGCTRALNTIGRRIMRTFCCLAWVLTAATFAAADEAKVPCFVSTWDFGEEANHRAMEVLMGGGDLLDAVEQGIRVTEADASNTSVGIGGTPNAEGVVQLDACIMDGRGHRAGGVAAIEGIRYPISAARLVMEHSPHVLLVGDGARQFAIQHGAEEAELLTEARAKEWQSWRKQKDEEPVSAQNHDTIAMIGIDREGNVVGGCSTSGMGYKIPGRVGDSPILGSGLYVDNEVGGAGATGIGENVMRYCGSFMIVEAMRHGMSPQQACETAIRRIERLDPLGFDDLHINFVAVNKQGEWGAAGTDQGFNAAITNPDGDFVRTPVILTGSSDK